MKNSLSILAKSLEVQPGPTRFVSPAAIAHPTSGCNFLRRRHFRFAIFSFVLKGRSAAPWVPWAASCRRDRSVVSPLGLVKATSSSLSRRRSWAAQACSPTKKHSTKRRRVYKHANDYDIMQWPKSLESLVTQLGIVAANKLK